MSNVTVDSGQLEKILDKATKIIEGSAPYSSNRQKYLESVIDNQVSLGYEIKDLVEGMDYGG